MNQSSFIAGCLLAGFVLWLAANDRLSVYTAILWGNPSNGTGGSGATADSGSGAKIIVNAGGATGTADVQPQVNSSGSVAPSSVPQLPSVNAGLSGLGNAINGVVGAVTGFVDNPLVQALFKL